MVGEIQEQPSSTYGQTNTSCKGRTKIYFPQEVLHIFMLGACDIHVDLVFWGMNTPNNYPNKTYVHFH